jgi:hypothetical protein
MQRGPVTTRCGSPRADGRRTGSRPLDQLLCVSAANVAGTESAQRAVKPSLKLRTRPARAPHLQRAAGAPPPSRRPLLQRSPPEPADGCDDRPRTARDRPAVSWSRPRRAATAGGEDDGGASGGEPLKRSWRAYRTGRALDCWHGYQQRTRPHPPVAACCRRAHARSAGSHAGLAPPASPCQPTPSPIKLCQPVMDSPAGQVGDARAHAEHISRPPAEDQKSPPQVRIAQRPRPYGVSAGHGPAVNINAGQAVPSQRRAPVAQRIEQGTSNLAWFMQPSAP